MTGADKKAVWRIVRRVCQTVQAAISSADCVTKYSKAGIQPALQCGDNGEN